MKPGRGWLVALAVIAAAACTLPSADEFARPRSADAGAASDAEAIGDDATTTAPDATSGIAPYVRFDPPARALTGADLTATGPLDWVQWQDPTEQCSGCTRYIGALDSASPITNYTDDNRTWSWTNGTPDKTGSASAGVFIQQVGGALVLPVRLPDTPVLITLHGDTYHSSGRLEATLDGLEGGLPPGVSVPVDEYGYAFVIHAYGPARTLHLTWTMTGGATGDANLAVAALTLAPEP